MEHKDFLSTWRRTCMHTREKDVFLPEFLEDFSRTNSTIRTIPCDVCGNSHVFRESRCFAHNSAQNCLADFLTKSSAKAENLITTVKTGRLLEVDVHPNFRTVMEHKAYLSAWCRIFMHTWEKKVFFLNTVEIPLTPTQRKGSFHVMFVGTSMDSESQDATKITSALADPRIYSSIKMMTVDMYMVAITIFSVSYFPFFPSVVAMPTSKSIGVCSINRWTKSSAE